MTCIAVALSILVGAHFGAAYGLAAFFGMVGLMAMADAHADGR